LWGELKGMGRLRINGQNIEALDVIIRVKFGKGWRLEQTENINERKMKPSCFSCI
jgi:hypothetical protein